MSALLWLLSPTLALAAAPGTAEGTQKQAPASAGATELTGQGEFTKAAEKDAESKDATQLDIAAGGILSTGNARSLAVTGLGNFLLRRKIHQFSANVAGNYGRAAVDKDSDPEATAGNVQGRVRYDIFVHERVSLFTMVTARHDPFLGLDLRLNVDPGVAVFVLTNPKHRMWFEAGYDFQYDMRREDAIIEKDADGNPVLDADGDTIQIADEEALRHSARLFAGYSNKLSELVSFDTGIEYLQSVTSGKTWRLNWDNALTTQIKERFSLAATFTLRVDNNPLPDIEKVDTITSINLIFRII